MYLTDGEVRDLFTRQLSWLRDGGYIFFRESCYHQSGNSPRGENHTLYHSPGLYNTLIQAVSKADEKGGYYGFEVVYSRSIQAYVKVAKAERHVDESLVLFDIK